MRTSSKYLLSASLVGLIGAAGTMAQASSHREAPAISGMPRVDGTDFYMFRSYEPGKEAFVTLIANYVPLQAPYGGPNYFTLDKDAIYEIMIDNDGDAVEDITFQFDYDTTLINDDIGITLDIDGIDVAIPLRQAGPIVAPNDPTINEREGYTVEVIMGDRRSGTRGSVTDLSGRTQFAKPIDNIGLKTIPDYPAYADQHQYIIRIPGCNGNGRMFVGQRAEAFAVNLGEIFDLVNLVPIEGDSRPGARDGGGFPGGITQDRANDDLIGEFNVTSFALEVPIDCLVGEGNGTIGGWTTASLPQARILDPSPSFEQPSISGGAFVQVSRLGSPLVNELVIGLKDKNLFNAAEPTQDAALLDYVTNPTLPALLDVLFRDAVNTTLGTDFPTIAPTNFPREDLQHAFLLGFPGLNQLATVTPSEMLRLNTAVAPTPREDQSRFGVVGSDLAGFPNGRRPGDDAVDIALRVVMGRLCHPVPIGNELGLEEDNINLGICRPGHANVGTAPFTDGAPLTARNVDRDFPYLRSPIPGSPNDAQQ